MATISIGAAVSFTALIASATSAQIADNPGFKALPRPIHYATPLAPTNGPGAVIVYGKLAPWTQKAAEAMQKAIQDWSGVKLELADDRTVTSDETWLLTDAWRNTPMIVLGNAQDNRVLHALGTRYLCQSTRTWPGGDRYYIHTVFEPFDPDVNYITLEASTQAGMDAGVAKFAETLKPLPQNATLPFTRVTGCVKDAWSPDPTPWQIPEEYQGDPNRSATEIARQVKGTPATAGWGLNCAQGGAYYLLGGLWGLKTPGLVEMTPQQLRTAAAILLNGGRVVGNRTSMPVDHANCLGMMLSMRGAISSGVLNEKEVNELENFMVLSAAHPNEYLYDHIGSDSGFVNMIGGRHASYVLLYTTHLLEYVRTHCRMDEKTRKEIDRRHEGMRKTLARYDGSFRDSMDTVELGETAITLLYAMLHQGMMENVKSGLVRLSADTYAMTTDNLMDFWNMPGRYAGLDTYISCGAGAVGSTWPGRGIMAAAAYYCDDPRYRWYIHYGTGRWEGIWGASGAAMMGIHWDAVGPTAEPTMYYGVKALPFDRRLYAMITEAAETARWSLKPLGVPGPLERCVDRIAFRDGMRPSDAYMFLATTQRINGGAGDMPLQNNSIARYTDLNELWLYHNSMGSTAWSRNVVSISNGRPYKPQAGCTLEAISNLGDLRITATRENSVSGAAWTRSIIHWKGHYFAVLDHIEALADDDFNLVCRWRTPQPASFVDGAWLAVAPGGSTMRLESPDAGTQTTEHWDSDGGGCRPYVLSQYKQARLTKGSAETFQNLLSVSGNTRPDSFQIRRVHADTMVVKGSTAEGEHLALIGAHAGLALEELESDSSVHVLTDGKLYLAGLTTLKKKSDGGEQELFWSASPVNLRVDTESGQGQIEVPGEKPVACRQNGVAMEARPGTAALSLKGPILPKSADILARLWETSASSLQPLEEAVKDTGPDAAPFRVLPADVAVARPPQQLSGMLLSSTPPSNLKITDLTDGMYQVGLAGNQPTWHTAENLEILLEFAQPVDVSCLRLVGILGNGKGFKYIGRKYNEADDFTFSVILSNDGFQADKRVVESPAVVFEETAVYPTFHYAMARLPTWRIEVADKARQIKILPLVTGKNTPELCLTEIEAYGVQPASITARVFAADINGDGANEFIVATSGKEVAAYDSDGRRLWSNRYKGDTFTMGCVDLDEDGKSEVLVYGTNEELHRVNGDGTERPVVDLNKAQLATGNPPLTGGMMCLVAWGPDDVKKKEVLLFSEGSFRVTADGQAQPTSRLNDPRGALRIANLVPGEPEVLAAIGYSVELRSARRDEDGNYLRLGQGIQCAGPGSAACMKGFCWIWPVNLPKFKGILAANEGGINWCPLEAFQIDGQENDKEKGWGFSASGVPVTAALAGDIDGDGVPEVFLARRDGFVNVLNLADGSPLGLLNAGAPVLGMAMLKGKDGNPCLAMGTKFAVHLFGADLQPIGRQALPAVAFAGPGGKDRYRVYEVDAAGRVTVLVLP